MIWIDSILLVVGVLSIIFPYNIGLSSNNIYIFYVSSISRNFVFVWCIMFIFLVIIHLIQIRKKQELLDKRTDILLIVVFIITILLSIL